MTYEDNIIVFKDTRTLSHSKYLVETKLAVDHTVVVDPAAYNFKANRKRKLAPVEFYVCKTLSGLVAFYGPKNHVAVLNFADPYTPGGLVESGEFTQEEDLCRCTNLYECLIKEDCIRDYYEYNRAIDDDVFSDRFIYFPDVSLIKYDTTYTKVKKKKIVMLLLRHARLPSVRMKYL